MKSFTREPEGKEPVFISQSSTADCPPPDGAGYRVEGSGPLLVYIAGLDGTGELFFKQTTDLSRFYRVVTFRSRDEGRFTCGDLADDVAAIMAALKETRATIVGESFGGAIALTFALRHPALVERLVIINSFPRFRNRFRIRLAAWLASILPFRLTWIFRWAIDTLGLMAEGVSREDRRRFFDAIRTVRREGYARRLRLIAGLDIEARLSEIQAPTLFIAGNKDLLVSSVREAQAMAARVPNSKVKIIEGAGHACLLNDRVRLAEMLVFFERA